MAALLLMGAAGNLAFHFGVTRPLAAAQQGHHQRLVALRRQILALQDQGRTLEGQLRTLRDLETYRGQLPGRDRMVHLGEELTRLAETAGVRMPGVTYHPEPVAEVDLLRVRLTLGVEGPYAQVRRFLHELEKRRRYLVVERMALGEQRGTSAGANHVTMQLNLAGYFR